MRQSTNLQSVHVEPKTRANQETAIERARNALCSAEVGQGLIRAQDFLAGMTLRAKAAQLRIQEAMAAKRKRAAE